MITLCNDESCLAPAGATEPKFIARHGLRRHVWGAPGGMEGAAARIDRVTGEAPCPECGHRREYWPFLHGLLGADRHLGGSYRAFSICIHCGLEEEF